MATPASLYEIKSATTPFLELFVQWSLLSEDGSCLQHCDCSWLLMLPSSTNRSSLRSWFSFCLSLSICSCDHPPCGKVYCLLVYHCLWLAHAIETCFALVMVAANDWAIRCCYGCSGVLFWITDFLKPLFFLCKGKVMLRQMESVLCGRFAVTNKIADNLPFSPHRQKRVL